MNPSRTEGKKDQMTGNIKETMGGMMGNKSMESEGQTQRGEGNVQEKAANVTGYMQGLGKQVSGTMKDTYNSLTGNTSGEAGGKAEQKTGEAQKKWNA
ncbi:hypothetical protein G6F57_003712 [Rhizopus arrhizus]|uniref:CsbD-like domain-containing protein n=1 Tax=Rhizopus oryzae TaxID=64495 RepID=A0A9P7BU01_RHIOR|nr:hypothetical protein G6F23_001830 [Rhizopus arrhizus]KAG1416645.1 hypothetical protein G6F58_005882 [Rhizopus delemar]KAG0766316.1 hypothetical protein G6F24_003706 [Rhizopus arrhizus]KAG0788588.1 hypothetical protein G6F22_006960 [Rhizopus arrhizus]KAG0789718.1 hypothetical protein G6F21_006325 [Rhizopus arrhizus]